MGDDICGVIVAAVFGAGFVVEMGRYDFLNLLCDGLVTYALEFLLSRMEL